MCNKHFDLEQPCLFHNCSISSIKGCALVTVYSIHDCLYVVHLLTLSTPLYFICLLGVLILLNRLYRRGALSVPGVVVCLLLVQPGEKH